MVRSASPLVVALMVCSVGLATPAGAQEASPQPVGAGEASSWVAQAPQAPLFRVPVEPRRRDARPAALLPLYVSFGALQALDAHSTSRALSNGAVEANPAMRPFTGSTAGMLAVKAAATTGIIYASERMWKRNRTAAVVFMVAANSAMIWVVQHNYRAVR
ncbi:MAG TPA: DUF5658 family protein [Vicinamibacterales bacterium]|nr:DUF5658 family protein [Vicinamibacterales bacterium]